MKKRNKPGPKPRLGKETAHMMCIRVPREQIREWRAEAKDRRTTVSDLIRSAVTHYIEHTC